MVKKVPPKGCLAIRVGNKEEQQQPFVVPVKYLNHPLFAILLKEAKDEFGLQHNGAIIIPYHVDDFHNAHPLIDRENSSSAFAMHQHHHHDHHHHHLPLAGCFRA
ncbi:Small auxin-up RNA protein [Dioscorea alata]|uniref:Small auxin-up RNA protein n=1 Tax=Dioscorea alata TaxID=55571 RepID=A0ACB7U6G6_DIOAL|nr:Small auxin-up RNA protein [Dioscorea alata]